jgi:hypothetical protein
VTRVGRFKLKESDVTEQTKSQKAEADLSDIERIVRQKIKEGQIPGIDHFTEEQTAAFVELCALYDAAPIRYAIRLKELKETFDNIAIKHIDRQVKKTVEAEFPAKVNLETNDEIVEELIRIAKQEADLWHNEYRVGYATIERDGHSENLEVKKSDFQYFIIDKFGEEWQENGEPRYPPELCVKSALYHIENHARRGDERDPRIRVAAYRGDLWIDIGNREWSAIVVNHIGWRIKPKMEAPLIRGPGMKALPIPVEGGDIRELGDFVNLRDEGALVLFCGMTATILNPFGNYQTAILCGPAGSGKTTATRVMRRFTDPNKNDTRRFGNVRDTMHGACNTHVVALENVSKISDDLSDTICRLNTGTGDEERMYYKQGLLWQISTKNPVIINGIPTNLASRSDLLERTVTFVFDYLGDKFSSDDVFWTKLDEAAPRIFGAVLDGLVGAMKTLADFGGDINKAAEALLGDYHPRFVDAVVWGEAFCRAAGFKPGEFVEAYRNNQDIAMRHIAENDAICIGIRKLMVNRDTEWRGYPAQLSAAIRPYVDIAPSAETIGKQLPWVIPVLKKVDGIPIVMHKRLAQNDNRNGIIIGVGRGRLNTPQVITPVAPRLAWRRF